MGDQPVYGGWVTRGELRRFNHAANHPEGAGRDSLHGSRAKNSPQNPMSHDEAVGLVGHMLREWITFKSVGR